MRSSRLGRWHGCCPTRVPFRTCAGAPRRPFHPLRVSRRGLDRRMPSIASSPTPDRRLRGHIPVLDGLRGIAVLLVILNHIGRVLEAPWDHAFDLLANKLAGSTWLGVDLFFVLSGFLITGILLDSRERPHYFRNF